MFRKTVFWLHLGTGVVVGIVVAMLSVTGVLLTYERQLIERADAKSWPTVQEGAELIGVADIAAAAEASGVGARRVTYYRNSEAPVLVGGGRRAPSTYVNAYSGEVLGQPENATRDFMRTMTNWHRWFDTGRDNRATGQFIVGASNVAFLFLLVSGAYLWLPKIFRWVQFRERLRFAKSYRNSQTRDFYWHHIFASWSFIPLLVIIVTGVIISFDWAHHLLEKAAGDDQGRQVNTTVAEPATGAQRLPLDTLLEQVKADSASWNSVSLNMPAADSDVVTFDIDSGSGRQPHKRSTVVLNAYNGDVVDSSGYADRPAETRAISMNRYLHTGEWFGVVGQTIAGLVSIAALFMVWTGFALAWRRLIVPLYSKKRA